MFALSNANSTLARVAPGSTKGRQSQSMRGAVDCRAHSSSDDPKKDDACKLAQKSVASLAALSMFVTPVAPAFAADKGALMEKGHAFAEASADVLRAAPAKDLTSVISAAVDVAVSVKPDKALKAVDAGLEALETASPGDLVAVVKAAEHATSAAIDAGQLIPSNEEIDKVVDAAAGAAAGVSPAALSKFAKAATEAATSADGKKIGNLTFAGGKLGISVGPGKITAVTAAALDLIKSL